MKQQSHFGEAEAQRILERAAEIDVQEQKRLDAAALRDIATAAGISPASVDKALDDHLRARPSLTARVLRRPGLLITAVILGSYLLARLIQ